MKEIIAVNPQVRTIYRFTGKKIYIRYSTTPEVLSMIQQIESKGGRVVKGKNWYMCDIIGENTSVKIGEEQFEVKEKTEEEIEQILVNHFLSILKKAGFSCEVKEIQ